MSKKLLVGFLSAAGGNGRTSGTPVRVVVMQRVIVSALFLWFSPMLWADSPDRSAPERPGISFEQFVRQVTLGDPVVVPVDCTAGDESIAAALRAKSGHSVPLVLEIRGVCEEDLEITRDKVTLRGGDPDIDGIHGSVTVRNADNIRIESLGIRGAEQTGVSIWHADVFLENVAVTDHGRDGLVVTGAGDATALASVFGNNGQSGATAQRGARFIAGECRFEQNRRAVAASGGGEAIVFDIAVSGRFGLSASSGGRLRVFESSIAADSYGLLVTRGGWADAWNTSVSVERSLAVVVTQTGHAELYDLEVEGDFRVDDRGYLQLIGVQQISNPTFNLITSGGQLDAWPFVEASKLRGFTAVSKFATLLLNQTSGIEGNLSCFAGGTAYLDDPSRVTGTVVGCNHDGSR